MSLPPREKRGVSFRAKTGGRPEYNNAVKEKTMITADEARKITNSVVKNECRSPLFKYAMDQIERYVRDASSCGHRSFSFNINVLAPGYGKPELHLRKAVAEKLRKNGFSYCETFKGPNCVWFEVGW